MTAASTLLANNFQLARNLSWWEADANCEFVLSQPTLDPALWREYTDGAQQSYRRHGVECALDLDALLSGHDTIMFFVAVDPSGRVLGGARAIGPLRAPEESHAFVEWDDQPGQQEVREMIAQRLPDGMIELKSGWKVNDPDRNRWLTDALARIGCHIGSLLNVRYIMATAATTIVDKWRTGGCVVAPVPATPYPNERYRTQLVFWDRRTFAAHATPEQACKTHFETTQLLHDFYRTPELHASVS
jgi:hypothetical protein